MTTHFHTWESVIFQDDLMDDSGSWFPETDSVFGPGSGQEVVDFGVHIFGPGQILGSLDLSLDQMIAVDRRRNSHFLQPPNWWIEAWPFEP